MSTIAPFRALRPQPEHAPKVASRPYDVLNSQEAKVEARGNPLSFLHITKAEIDLPDSVDIHAEEVYQRARQNLEAFRQRGILFRESKPCYYLYRLEMNGQAQTGIVCGSSLQDYDNDLIKKHEYTRPEKEEDRINHIAYTGAQTGNVFLAYRSVDAIDALVENWKSTHDPVYDFTTEDAIRHTLWVINHDETIAEITGLFNTEVPATYIADGHHRAASAAKVRARLKDKSPESDYFLTTLFPDNQLRILDYNRVVKDLNGLSADELIEKIRPYFTVTPSAQAVRPAMLHQFGMYIDGKWYVLEASPDSYDEDDPIGVLDITILSSHILEKILGITDQRTDKRIDFVGGIRGVKELEQRVNSGEMAVAFSLYPVTLEQLLDIADSGNVMPPKSTWLEPKLRDGLLTHIIAE